MQFFFNDFWSGFWLAALFVAGLITLAGNVKAERRILHVMIANWLCVRTIVYFGDYNAYAFLVLSVLTCVTMAAYTKTGAGKVCAGLFFMILQLDILNHAQLISFQQAAEVQDAIGFLILFIMAGASHDWRIRRAGTHIWGRGDSRGFVTIPIRYQASNASGVALAQDTVQENR